MSTSAARGKADDERTRLLLAVVQELYASAMQGTSEIWHKIYQQCSLLLESEAGGFISTDKVNQAADIASLIGFDQEKAIRAYRDYGVEVDLLFMGTLSMGAGEHVPRHREDRFPGPAALARSTGSCPPRWTCASSAAGSWRTTKATIRRSISGGARTSPTSTRRPWPRWRPSCPTSARPSRCSGGSAARSWTARRWGPSRWRPSGIRATGFSSSTRRGRCCSPTGRPSALPGPATASPSATAISAVDDTQIAAEIERMMSRALGISRDTGFAPMRPLRIPRKSGGHSYEFLMIPVTDGAQRAILPPTAAFMVAITDPETVVGVSHQRLRGYGLTGAEARLCQALIRTGSLQSRRGRAAHQPEHGPQPPEEHLHEARRDVPGPAGHAPRRGAARKSLVGS